MLTQHIREFVQVTPGPFPNFCVGPGLVQTCFDRSNQTLSFHVHVFPVQKAVGQLQLRVGLIHVA